jgi:hypothetical protein
VPRNLYLPYVAPRIYDSSPNAKLIVLVRNPIERAFSHWYHDWSRQLDPLDFRSALRADLARIEQGCHFESQEEAEEYVRMLSPLKGVNALLAHLANY